MNGCLSLSLSVPAMNWPLVYDVILSTIAGSGLIRPPRNPECRNKQVLDLRMFNEVFVSMPTSTTSMFYPLALIKFAVDSESFSVLTGHSYSVSFCIQNILFLCMSEVVIG